MNVQELIAILVLVEDKSKEVRLLSTDHSNDIVGNVEVQDSVFIIGE